MDDNLVVVDTSAWISALRRDSDAEMFIRNVLDNAISAGVISTVSLIKLELLQGTRTQREFDDLKLMLESLRELSISSAVWERAYDLGFTLRRNGLTIPTTDVVIAAVALEYDCAILHQDRHFPMIQSVVPLRIIEIEAT